MRNMIKALKKKYALSDQGASDLFKGILYSVLANISLMLPVILLAVVLNQLLSPILGIADSEKSAAFYTITGIVILAVVFILHYLQYTAAYVGTYEESARRRIHLAEKLRTLPLGFFHQRDLSDLTSTIMGDCASFEHAFSHTVPQFWGAVISTGIVCIGLLIFNWQMGLALLWVAPVSFAIVLLSRKWQQKLGKRHMEARIELAEGIQECLETVQDIKACNQEEAYLKKLDAKMDAAEKAQISSELTTASLITTGQMFLRLGLATVIIVGNSLVMKNQTDIFTYILFLIAASRLYDPLSGAMSNMAELFGVSLQVKRLKEIEEYPDENGEKDIRTNVYDITFDHVKFSYEKDKPVLRDVSFTAKQGQVTALVGPSGGGKSTVARLITGLLPCTEGKVLFYPSSEGTEAGCIDISQAGIRQLKQAYRHMQMVFQMPAESFDPRRTLGDGIGESLRNMGIKGTELKTKVDNLLELCGLTPEFASRYPHQVSGGQCQRAAIARALAPEPELLICDEATSALDVTVQKQIMELLIKLRQKNGLSVIFICHDLALVQMFCDRVIVMKQGKIVETGTPEEIIWSPREEYTRNLIESVL